MCHAASCSTTKCPFCSAPLTMCVCRLIRFVQSNYYPSVFRCFIQTGHSPGSLAQCTLRVCPISINQNELYVLAHRNDWRSGLVALCVRLCVCVWPIEIILLDIIIFFWMIRRKLNNFIIFISKTCEIITKLPPLSLSLPLVLSLDSQTHVIRATSINIPCR